LSQEVAAKKPESQEAQKTGWQPEKPASGTSFLAQEAAS